MVRMFLCSVAPTEAQHTLALHGSYFCSAPFQECVAWNSLGCLWCSRGTGMFRPKQQGKFSPAACARRTQKIRTRMALSWWRKIGADVRGQHGCQFSDPKCFGVCDTETSETQHIPPHLLRSVPCQCLNGKAIPHRIWHIMQKQSNGTFVTHFTRLAALPGCLARRTYQ